MKSIAFLALLGLVAAYEYGSYQPREIGVSDGQIYISYQAWRLELRKPVDSFNYLEIYVYGPNGFSRRVVIDNKFTVVKDFYNNNDFAKYYQQQVYGQVPFLQQGDYSQFEYLLPIFRQYIGVLDLNQWSQLLNNLQVGVQQNKVHFLVYEFIKNFGVSKEFFYGKYSYQYYGPQELQGQYYGNGQYNYGKNIFNKYFGKYYDNNQLISQDYYGQNQKYYGKQYDQYNGPYNQEFNGPYNQQYYGQEYYSPYNQQYYGQGYYRPYNQQYYGQEYYGPNNQGNNGQELSKPYYNWYYGSQYQYRPYEQQIYGKPLYSGQSYAYPQYQGSYYGQSNQYPSYLSKFRIAY